MSSRYTLIGMGFLEFLAIVVILIAGPCLPKWTSAFELRVRITQANLCKQMQDIWATGHLFRSL
jgi:hypothetical protein